MLSVRFIGVGLCCIGVGVVWCPYVQMLLLLLLPPPLFVVLIPLLLGLSSLSPQEDKMPRPAAVLGCRGLACCST